MIPFSRFVCLFSLYQLMQNFKETKWNTHLHLFFDKKLWAKQATVYWKFSRLRRISDRWFSKRFNEVYNLMCWFFLPLEFYFKLCWYSVTAPLFFLTKLKNLRPFNCRAREEKNMVHLICRAQKLKYRFICQERDLYFHITRLE